jgi:hypothetical protein
VIGLGRRDTDKRLVGPPARGFLKDARGKRSYGRLLLSGLMLAFLWMLFHDIFLVQGNLNPPISNAAWHAWEIAFAGLTTVVFGKDALDLWKNGGFTAIAAVATANRDTLADVTERRTAAAAVPHDPEDPQSEYTP